MLSLNEYKDIIIHKRNMIGTLIPYDREINRKCELAKRYSDDELEDIILSTENFLNRIAPNLLSRPIINGYATLEFEPAFRSINQTIAYNNVGDGDELFSLDDDPSVLYSIGILEHMLPTSIITKTITQEKIPGVDKMITGGYRVICIPKIIMDISEEDMEGLSKKYVNKPKSK